jgi:hypothetical protein
MNPSFEKYVGNFGGALEDSGAARAGAWGGRRRGSRFLRHRKQSPLPWPSGSALTFAAGPPVLALNAEPVRSFRRSARTTTQRGRDGREALSLPPLP